MGGLGIFAACTVIIIRDQITNKPGFIIYSGLIVAAGTIDDIWDIDAVHKLSGTDICALLAALSGIRFHIEYYVAGMSCGCRLLMCWSV